MKKVKKVTILCLIAAISVLIAIGCSNDNSSDEPEATPAVAATEDTQTPAAANPPAETPVSRSEGDNEEEPENPTYTITFNVNEGSWITGYEPETSYEENTNVTLPDSTKVHRAYYRFLGWFENETDTTPVTSISNIDGNKSYIAKWERYPNAAVPGEYMTEDGQIRACPAGTYNSLPGRTSCIPCPAGHYNDEEGQSLCKSCAAGTYSSSSGATSCTACGDGTVSSAGASNCRPCAAGQYPNNGHSACES